MGFGLYLMDLQGVPVAEDMRECGILQFSMMVSREHATTEPRGSAEAVICCYFLGYFLGFGLYLMALWGVPVVEDMRECGLLQFSMMVGREHAITEPRGSAEAVMACSLPITMLNCKSPHSLMSLATGTPHRAIM